MNSNNIYYKLISEFYKDKITERSKQPLMNHIDEGLLILDEIGASEYAQEAYCIHPILQSDDSVLYCIGDHSPFVINISPNPIIVILAMEYRHVANAYLSQHCKSEDDVFNLSVMRDVNDMLIADKIQNRKDFELYHIATHENSATLQLYFSNWLRKLGISEEGYQSMKRLLTGPCEQTNG